MGASARERPSRQQGGGTVVDWIKANRQYAGGNVVGAGLPEGWSVVGRT